MATWRKTLRFESRSRSIAASGSSSPTHAKESLQGFCHAAVTICLLRDITRSLGEAAIAFADLRGSRAGQAS